jgi:hypothetical protein
MPDSFRALLVAASLLPLVAAADVTWSDAAAQNASINLWAFPWCQPVRFHHLGPKLATGYVDLGYYYQYIPRLPNGCIKTACTQRGWCISEANDSGPIMPTKLSPNGCQQVVCTRYGSVPLVP